MVATVEICESNTSTEVVTHNVSNINFGSVDMANLVAASYPITVGTQSYTKYIRYHVTAMGGSNRIDNLQVWKSAGNYVTGEGIQCNLRTTGYSAASFATPTQNLYTNQTMPVAAPGAANLGIGGVLTGGITAIGYSDYLLMQLQTTVSTPAGDANQKTFTFQYDEQ
jgi:hypothetical protein